MAIYRNISIGFWADAKVYEDLDIEERYLFLYLLTNTHTNLCGCYEVGVRQAMNETGMTKVSFQKAMNALDHKHNMIRYDSDNNEVLILHWNKYNWSRSEKLIGAVKKEIANVKTESFKRYLYGLIDRDTPMDRGTDLENTPTDTTVSVSVSVTDTVTDTDAVTDAVQNSKSKHQYSEDPELDQAIRDFIEHRNKLKRPMTDHAVDLLIGKLNKITIDPVEQIALINTAIEHGWQTVYEPKEKPRSGTPPDKYALIDAWAKEAT